MEPQDAEFVLRPAHHEGNEILNLSYHTLNKANPAMQFVSDVPQTIRYTTPNWLDRFMQQSRTSPSIREIWVFLMKSVAWLSKYFHSTITVCVELVRWYLAKYLLGKGLPGNGVLPVEETQGVTCALHLQIF
jgi:hypothetical protein